MIFNFKIRFVRIDQHFVLFIILILNALLLAVPSTSTAESTQTAQTEQIRIDIELKNLKENSKIQIDALKDNFQKDIQLVQQRVNGQDKLIDVYLSGFALLLVITSFVAYFSANQKAKDTAKEITEKWFLQNTEVLSNRIGKLNQRIEKVEQLANTKEREIEDTVERSKEIIESYSNTYIEYVDEMHPGKNPKPTKTQLAAFLKLETELQNKPENEYTLEDWVNRAYAALANEKLELAAKFFESAEKSNEVTLVQKAQFKMNRAYIFTSLNRHIEAIATYDELLSLYENNPQPELEKGIAVAFYGKGDVLLKLEGKEEETILAYSKFLDRYEESYDPQLQELIADSIHNKVFIFKKLGNIKEALTANERIVNRFVDSLNPRIQKITIEALFNKGLFLNELGEYRAAIEAFDIFLKRYERSVELEILIFVGLALFGKSFALNKLEEYPAAQAAYEKFLERFENSRNLRLQEVVAKALNNIALIYINERNEEKAINALDKLLAHFKDSHEIKLQIQSAMAFYQKADLLAKEDAIEVYNELLKYFESTTETSLHVWVAGGLYNKATKLIELGKIEDAIAIYDSILKRFGDSDKTEIHTIVAMAHTNKIVNLVRENNASKTPEIFVACDEFLEQFEKNSIPEIEESVARAFNTKIISSLKLRKEKDANSTFKTFLDRFANSTNAVIQEIIKTTLPLNWNWALEWINQRLEHDSNNFESLDFRRHCLWELGKFEESVEINKSMIEMDHPNRIFLVLQLLEALALMNEATQFETVSQKYKAEIESDSRTEQIIVFLHALQNIVKNDLSKAKSILLEHIPDITTGEIFMYFLDQFWSFNEAWAFISRMDTQQQKQYLEHLIKYFSGRMSGNEFREFLSRE